MSAEERSDRPDLREGEAQPEPRPAAAKERGILIRCLRVVVGAVTFVCAIVPPSLVFDWSIGPLAQVVLAIAAGGLLSFHLVNIFRTRVTLKHWEIDGIWRLLRSEILAGCVVPIWVIVLVLSLPPAWWMLLLLAGVFGFSQLIYEPVQREIREKVDDANKEHGTKHFRKRKLLTKFGVDKSLDEMAEEEQGPGLWKYLIALGKDPWQAGLSRTRSLVVYILIACACFAAAAAADVYVHDQVHGQRDKAPKSENGERTDTGSTNAGESADVETVGQGGSGEGVGSDDSGDDVDVRCRFDPGIDVPIWVKRDLYALYYGGTDLNATDPPGTDVGGCPGDVSVLSTPEGRFFYAVATGENGETLSAAVTSRRRKPAIFLAPAAQRVIELIDDGVVPLGGYPRVDVKEGEREGDMVAVTTPRGTIVLVRAEKVLPGMPEYASPYVELPIAVASAWAVMMRTQGCWLWPLEPRRQEEEIVYRFSRSADGDPEVSISYNPETATATADGADYRPPQIQLGQLELREFARRAGRG